MRYNENTNIKVLKQKMKNKATASKLIRAALIVGCFFAFYGILVHQTKAAVAKNWTYNGTTAAPVSGSDSSFTIQNSSPAGGESGSWSVSSIVYSGGNGWLQLSPSSGTIAAAGSQSVGIGISTANGGPPVNQTWTATISITGNNISPAAPQIVVNWSGINPGNDNSCTIVINSTGSPGTYNYTLSGPSTINGSGNNQYNNRSLGTWTISYTGGSSKTFSSYSPAQTQNCSSNQTITFTLNFTAAISNCVLNSFTATPSSITSGNTSNLNWTATNCWSMTLSGGQFNPPENVPVGMGMWPVSPTTTTTYTLTGGDLNGVLASRTVTVTVTAPQGCTINVNSTGSPGTYNYTISGPGTINGSGNNTFASQPTGTWTITYTGGSLKTFSTYSPAQSQSCAAGNTITFTLNFVSPALCTIIINSTGVAPASWTVGVTSPIGSGATGMSGNTPVTYTSTGQAGTYTVSFLGGGPPNPTSVSPSASQNCVSGTYTFTFNFPAGTPPGDPPGPPAWPAQPIADNSNTATLGPVPCGQVKLYWGTASGATSYNLYRSQTTTPGAVWQTTTGLTYTDTTASPGGSYYYWVQAANAFGTSNLVLFAQTTTAPVPCSVNLSTAGKNITAVNGLPYTFSSNCIPSQTGTVHTIKKGDRVSFNINICNSGTANASNVVVTDDFTNSNLSNVRNISFNPSAGTSYSQVGNVFTFNVGSIGPGFKAQITFDADVTAPVGNTQSLLRLKNVANITYNSALPPGGTGCIGSSATSGSPCVVSTGYVVFYNGLKAPIIKEVNP